MKRALLGDGTQADKKVHPAADYRKMEAAMAGCRYCIDYSEMHTHYTSGSYGDPNSHPVPDIAQTTRSTEGRAEGIPELKCERCLVLLEKNVFWVGVSFSGPDSANEHGIKLTRILNISL